ncbi:GNAT family N-acetyltransferase, partial [Halorussus sp. GCM10023401]
MSDASVSDTDDAYAVRLYEPDDRDAYLSLYRRVFGAADATWFDWKYADNPYVDRVPMTVAEADGELVAAKPSLALRLSTPDGPVVALQPCDVMVDADHRRRGLYSRTTELLVEEYADRDPALFFNFPNAKTLAGSLKHGWEIVEEVTTYYRIQHPNRYLGADAGDALAALGDRLLDGLPVAESRAVDATEVGRALGERAA